MKPTRSLLSFLFGSVFLTAQMTQAATYYWDDDAITAGFGTAGVNTGTWAGPTTGPTAGWSLSGTGAVAFAAFTTATTDILNFGNGATGLGAGTINISGTVDAGNMTFASGSGSILLSGGTINLAAAQTTTVNNSTNTISSILSGAGTSFTKAGTGTLVFSGANSYTGTTIINGGTLKLNSATGSLATTTPLTFSGSGTFNMDNVGATGDLTQTLGVLTFSGGEGKVQITRTADFNQAITFASLAVRTPGATGNFVHSGGTNSATNGFIFTAAPTAGALIDRGIFYNGSSFATYDAGGFVRAFTAGDTDYLAAPTGATIGASTSSSNVDLTTGNITAQTTVSANTINMRNFNITMTGTSQVLSTNALLSSGSGSATLGGGTTPLLQAGTAGGELVVRVNGGLDQLTISSAIQNNTSASRLTKSGDGTLVLSTANTYSGGTSINAGTVRIGNATALGTSAGAVSVGSGARLDLNGITVNNTNALTLNGSGIGGTGALINTSNTNARYSGAITLNSDSTIGNTGTGTLILGSNPNNINTNGFTLTLKGVGGTSTINVPGNNALNWGIIGSGNVVVDNVYLDLRTGGNQSANTYTGTTSVINGSRILFYADNIGTGNINLNGGTLLGYANASLNTRGFGTGSNQIQITGGESGFGGGSGNFAFTNVTEVQWGNASFNPSKFIVTDGVNFQEGIDLNGVNRTILSSSATSQLSGVIRNTSGTAAGLIKEGGGTLLLSNTGNTYNGATTISAGILQAAATGSLGNSSATNTLIFNGGTLQATGAITSVATRSVTMTATGIIDNNGQAISIAGDIGGAGGLTKNGAGTLTLSGTLSYGGATTVTAGTLALNSALDGSNVSTSGTGIFTQSGTGVLSGSGVTFTQGSSGTSILSLANTYTGLTSVTDGTLIMTMPTALGNGGLTVATNKTFSYAPTTAGALDFGSGAITLATGSTIRTALGGTLSQSAITSTGAASLAGTGTININLVPGVAPAVGTHNLITAASGLGGGTYSLGAVYGNTDFTVSNFTRSASAISVDVAAATALSGDVFWKGGLAGNTGVWSASNGSTQSNWQVTDGVNQPLTPGATADLVFSTATSPGTMVGMSLGVNMTVRTLTINNTATAFGLGADGNTLTIAPDSSSAGITIGAGVLASSIAAPVVLGASQTWTNNSANALTVSGAVSGTASLTKAGTGTIILSGANTYNGGTNLNAGTLNVGSAGALGSTGTISFGGGTLQHSASNTTDYSGRFSTAASQQYKVDTNGQTVTWASNLTSSGGTLTKSGAGSLTVSGAGNSFTGGITLGSGGGTLTFSTVASWGGSGKNVTFTGNHTLASSAATYSGGQIDPGGNTATISGVSLTFASATGTGIINYLPAGGTNTLNLGNASSFTGNLQVRMGGGTNAYAFAQFSSINDAVGSSIQYGGSNGDSNQQASVQLTGNGGLVQFDNRSIQTIAGSNVRHVALYNNQSNGGTNKWVINTAFVNNISSRSPEFELRGTNTGDNEFAGVIANGSSILNVIKADAGKWILSGANTFTGSLVVNSGTLSVGNFNSASVAGPLGQGQFQLGGTFGAAISALADGSGTLQYTGGGNTTNRTVQIGDSVTAANTGGGSILNIGSGALVFTAANFNPAVATATGARTLTLGGTYTASANEIQGVIRNNSATGTVAVTKSGAGTWTLKGSNLYTGATTISAGSLLLGNGGNLAATAVSVNGGTFGINQNASATSNALAGTLALAAGSTLTMSDGYTSTFNVTGATTLAAASGASTALRFDIGGATTATDLLAITGAGTVGAGKAVVNFTGIGSTALTPGAYNFITAGSGMTASNFTLGTPNVLVNGVIYNLALSGTATTETVTVANGAVAAPAAFWTGSQSDGSWATLTGGTTSNFATDATGVYNTYVLPSSNTNVTFTANTATNLTTTLDQAHTINSLTFSGTGSSNTAGSTIASGTGGASSTLTINAAAVNGNTLGNGITVNSGSGANTISAPVVLGGAQSWTNNSANLLTVSGNIDNGANLLTIAGSGNTTISGILGSGGTVTGGLTVNASGAIVTLSGANAYTGNTTLTAGTLVANNAATPLGAASSALNLNGGTLDLRVNGTAYNTTVGGTTTIASNTPSSSAGITHTLGNLSIGANTLNITTGSNATGNTAGVTFGNVTQTGAAIFNVAANTTLTLGALQTSAQNITKQNSGTLIMNSAANAARVAGSTTLTAGTLKLGSASALGTTGTTLVLNGGTLDLAINSSVNAYNTTVGGAVTIASNTATSTAGITHTLGTLSIGAQTLSIAPGSNATGSTAGVTFGATTISGTSSAAVFSPAANSTLTLGTVTGTTPTITKSGAGSLVLSGTISSVTSLTINDGTVSMLTNNSTSNAALTIGASGTLNFNNGQIFGVLNGSGTINENGNWLYTNSASNGSFSGTINGTGGYIKQSTGTQTLSGLSSYSGSGIGAAIATQIQNGALSINTIKDVGGGNSSLGAPTTAAAGVISMGNAATTGTLIYTGAVQSTDRQIQIGTNSATPVAGDTGGATIQADGAGNAALTFSAANFNSQTNAATGTSPNRTLTLSGSSTGANTISGIIQNNRIAGVATAAVALTKAGAGNWTLSGANTYTGATSVNGGTLSLGFGTVTSNIISSSSALTMGGGTLQLSGAATSTQTVNGLTTTASTGSRILLAADKTLTLGALGTVGAASGLNFNTAAGGADAGTAAVGTSIVTLTGGSLLNSWTVTDSTGFGLATRNGSNQVIRDTGTALLPASGATSATNYRVDNNAGGPGAAGSSSLVVTASQSAASITMDNTANNGVLTLNSGVTVSSNTWNFGNASGTNTYQITGGTGLNSVASGNTISINNYNSGTVTFTSPILANGVNALVFNGTGTTVLDGLNTYSGTTTISGGGTLQIGANGRLTAGTYNQAITIGGGSTFRYSGSNAQTLSGAITGQGGITKDTNTSDLTLSNTGNTYTGTTNVSAGRILATAVTHLSSGATSIVQSGTGQVYLNVAATFTNPFNISGTGYLETGDSQNNVNGAIRLDNTANLSGTITLSGNSRIGKWGNSTSTISGQITGGFGIDFYGFQSTAAHAPTFVLSNPNNNYTGTTTIYNSNYNTTNLAGVSTTLKLGASNVIPDGASAGNVAFAINGTNNNATVILDLNGFNETINGLTVNAGTFASRITNSVAGNSVLTIGANNTTSSFGGTITNTTGTLAITKTGSGTLSLSGSNTYSGATTVSQGKLLVNNATGSGTGSAAVSVASGATLGGTGAIAGAVNVTGQLSPGASIETLGTGALALLNGSTLVHELDSSVGTGVGSDLLKVAGNLDLVGAVGLTLDDLAATDVPFVDNDVFSLINYTGTWNNGMFTFSGNELSDEEVFTFGLNTWKISYDDATGGLNYSGEFAGGSDSFVNLTVVSTIPEPGAVFLGSMGLLLILRRRR